MKITAFNGSARTNGNTAVLLKRVLRVLETEGFETEMIQLSGKHLKGCNACRLCFKTKNKRCVIEDDPVNTYIKMMLNSDAIILGSPVYFSMMTTNMKALIERAGYVARANSDMFKLKVGAAVVAVRRAGGMPTFDAINHFFLISQMIVPGSSYWNIGIGGKKGDVETDEEGMKIMDELGKNMAWLMKKLKTRTKPKVIQTRN
jgi:multimeric flavodoxin WrbA